MNKPLTQQQLKTLKSLLRRYALQLMAQDETIAIADVRKVEKYVEEDTN